jgi:hypothetical protein
MYERWPADLSAGDILDEISKGRVPKAWSDIFPDTEAVGQVFLRSGGSMQPEAPSLYLQLSFPRRICITDRGYIGMAPHLAEQGDLLCFIFGSQVPFLLRHVEDSKEMRYRLVGECYIHGMMDGEAFNLGCEETYIEIV